MEKITNNIMHFSDIPVIANSFGRKILQRMRPVMDPIRAEDSKADRSGTIS